MTTPGLALSPDGSTLVTASFDYSAVVWGAQALEEQATLLGHEAAVNTAAFSADGSLLATAGDDGSVLLWTKEQIGNDSAEPVVLQGPVKQLVRHCHYQFVLSSITKPNHHLPLLRGVIHQPKKQLYSPLLHARAKLPVLQELERPIRQRNNQS